MLAFKSPPNGSARMLAHVNENHYRALVAAGRARGLEAQARRRDDMVIIHSRKRDLRRHTRRARERARLHGEKKTQPL